MNELVKCACGRVHILSDVLFGGWGLTICDEATPNTLYQIDQRYLAIKRVPHPSVMW